MSIRSSAVKQQKRLHIGARDGWHCRYCKKPLGMLTATLDHIVPLSAGGSSRNENLCLSCWPCNRKKGSFSAEQFMSQMQQRHA